MQLLRKEPTMNKSVELVSELCNRITFGKVSHSVLKQLLAIGPALAGLLLSASRLPAACNQPPVPGPGQTVTWMAANSPFQLCSDLTIPATGTVIVEPGVTIQLQAHMITVDGIFNVQGSSTNHVVFSDTTVFPPAVTLDGGTIIMTFADFTGQLRSGPGSMTLADCSFTGPNGVIFGLDIFLPANPPTSRNSCASLRSIPMARRAGISRQSSSDPVALPGTSRSPPIIPAIPLSADMQLRSRLGAAPLTDRQKVTSSWNPMAASSQPSVPVLPACLR